MVETDNQDVMSIVFLVVDYRLLVVGISIFVGVRPSSFVVCDHHRPGRSRRDGRGGMVEAGNDPVTATTSTGNLQIRTNRVEAGRGSKMDEAKADWSTGW